jgi:hypothetical protein
MSDSTQDDRLERLKKEEGIDDTIAEQSDRSIHHIERELDPMLIEVMKKYLPKSR